MVREHEGVAGAGADVCLGIDDFILGDEEGGAEREDGARNNAYPVAEVAGADQGVNYIVELLRCCGSLRKRR